MSRRCSVAICGQVTSGFSKHCEIHKRVLRRHGHPEQRGVTAYELAPFRKAVEARRAKNPTNPTWRLLQARWESLAAHAAGTLDAYATGAASISYERMTAELLISLRDGVPADTVIDTALAMFAMEAQRSGRFRSDRAFVFELARRVRGLGDVNAGTKWDAKHGRMRRTYSEVPPRVLECIGASLQMAFGVAGMRLAELEKKDAEGKQAARIELHDALKEMQ